MNRRTFFSEHGLGPAARMARGALRRWRASWWLNRLDARDSAPRVKACRRLGELGDRRAVDPLTRLLAHEDAATSEAAFDALAAMDETRIAKAVRGAFRGSPEALAELADEGDTRALDPLLSRLGDRRAEIRKRVWAALAAMGPIRVKPLLVQLGDASPTTRKSARQALRAMGEERLGDAVARALAGEASGLAELEDFTAEDRERVVPAMSAIARTAPTAIRAAACQALGRLGNPRAAEVLTHNLGHVSACVREAALDALRLLGAGSLRQRALELLSHSDRQVVASACRLLTQTHSPRPIRQLTPLLGDHDPEVRNAAIEALADTGSDCIPALARAARSRVSRSRMIACRALGRLGSEEAIQVLLDLLRFWGSRRRTALVGLREAGLERLANTFTGVVRRDPGSVEELGRLVDKGDVRLIVPLGRVAATWGAPGWSGAIAALRELGPACTDALLAQTEGAPRDANVALAAGFKGFYEAIAPTLPEVRCRTCLTRFRRATTQVAGTRVRIAVCRDCGRSAEAMVGIDEIVAVLDRNAPRLTIADGVAYGNWLEQQAPFDFDRVEIIDATDYDIERFCIGVGNDTDARRKGRYRSLPCTISQGCEFSPAALRMVDHAFGEVTYTS